MQDTCVILLGLCVLLLVLLCMGVLMCRSCALSLSRPAVVPVVLGVYTCAVLVVIAVQTRALYPLQLQPSP